MNQTRSYDRYYLSYSGITLPLKLVGELDPAEIENRNTFFGAEFDSAGRQTLVHRVVYGEVDLEHRYGYHDNGCIQWAEILDEDGEVQRLDFAPDGQPV